MAATDGGDSLGDSCDNCPFDEYVSLVRSLRTGCSEALLLKSCYCLIVFPSYSLQAVGCGHTDSFMSRWLLDPPSPLLSNQNQLDTNADSIGDACQCESAPQLHVLQVACESVESPVTAAALLSICCGCVWMVLKAEALVAFGWC